MNIQEAELIGMHVGDGTLYLAGKTLVWELRGSIKEKEYYAYVKDLIKECLQVEVKPKFRGTNSYGIQTANKTITQFFINSGFKPGRKTYTVRVPENIIVSNKEIKLSFIRGLFDIDGCIRFEKNRTAIRYCPRIEFSFASENLVLDLFNLLKELGFRPYTWKNGQYSSLCMAGFEQLKKWINEVGSSNSKHFKKYQNFTN